MSDELATLLVLIAMLVGLVGTLLPILPGILLMWASAVAYGFAVGFDALAIVVLAVLSVLTGVALVAGVLLPKRAAVDAGAATSSQFAAAVGAVIGFFVIPIVGIIVGALVGIGLAEYHDKRDWPAARASTIAVAKGFGLSTIVQFVLGFVMVAVWLVWAQAVVF